MGDFDFYHLKLTINESIWNPCILMLCVHYSEKYTYSPCTCSKLHFQITYQTEIKNYITCFCQRSISIIQMCSFEKKQFRLKLLKINHQYYMFYYSSFSYFYLLITYYIFYPLPILICLYDTVHVLCSILRFCCH